MLLDFYRLVTIHSTVSMSKLRNSSKSTIQIPKLTFLNVLVLVKWHEGVILAEAPEGVDEMGAEVGVDVLRGELGVALPVDRPVGVVAHHLPVVNVLRGLSLLAQLCGHFS